MRPTCTKHNSHHCSTPQRRGHVAATAPRDVAWMLLLQALENLASPPHLHHAIERQKRTCAQGGVQKGGINDE